MSLRWSRKKHSHGKDFIMIQNLSLLIRFLPSLCRILSFSLSTIRSVVWCNQRKLSKQNVQRQGEGGMHFLSSALSNIHFIILQNIV